MRLYHFTLLAVALTTHAASIQALSAARDALDRLDQMNAQTNSLPLVYRRSLWGDAKKELGMGHSREHNPATNPDELLASSGEIVPASDSAEYETTGPDSQHDNPKGDPPKKGKAVSSAEHVVGKAARKKAKVDSKAMGKLSRKGKWRGGWASVQERVADYYQRKADKHREKAENHRAAEGVFTDAADKLHQEQHPRNEETIRAEKAILEKVSGDGKGIQELVGGSGTNAPGALAEAAEFAEEPRL